MIPLMLAILGLCMGSFVNALVWRLRKQETGSAKDKSLSIIKGRSMCSDCGHQLGVADLIPVLSWLLLKGRCRYCKKKIEDSPITEVCTALLFTVSYFLWPAEIQGREVIYFGLWLVFATGFMALIVYDKRWSLLPDKVVYPLLALALAETLLKVGLEPSKLATVVSAAWGVVIGGGIFYLLFQLSEGRWIGGGDVKLGAVLGLLTGGPTGSLLLLFIAAVLGCVFSLPLLVLKKVRRDSQIPFGPFLIIACVIVVLVGPSLIDWYQKTFLPFTL